MGEGDDGKEGFPAIKLPRHGTAESAGAPWRGSFFHLNDLSGPACGTDAQPFTAPTVRPCTKYFCRKGYSRIIGPVDTTTVAMR